MSDYKSRIDRVRTLTPEQRENALYWLSGYAPEAFDKAMKRYKPPRIPEPGPWGVVEATVEFFDGTKVRRRFVRHDTRGDYGPWHSKDARWARWDDLIDPVLIREGVES